jgi:hypothetical protein
MATPGFHEGKLMSLWRTRLILAVISVIGLFGCSSNLQEPTPKVYFPEIVVNESPPAHSADSSEPVVGAESPNSESLSRGPRFPKRYAPPTGRVKRNPFGGSAERPKPRPSETAPPEGKIDPPAEPPKKKPPPQKVSFVEPPDYPTYQIERLPSDPASLPSGSTVNLDNEAARPIVHPPIQILNWVDHPWLDVGFEVQANGSFTVFLITQTGDPVLNSIAIRTLNRWKWKPKTVDGVPVASTEFIRLKRRIKSWD